MNGLLGGNRPPSLHVIHSSLIKDTSSGTIPYICNCWLTTNAVLLNDSRYVQVIFSSCCSELEWLSFRVASSLPLQILHSVLFVHSVNNASEGEHLCHVKPISQIQFFILWWVDLWQMLISLPLMETTYWVKASIYQRISKLFPHFKLRVPPQLRYRHHCSVTCWIMHVLLVFNQGSGEGEMDVRQAGSEGSGARRGGNRVCVHVCVCVWETTQKKDAETKGKGLSLFVGSLLVMLIGWI